MPRFRQEASWSAVRLLSPPSLLFRSRCCPYDQLHSDIAHSRLEPAMPTATIPNCHEDRMVSVCSSAGVSYVCDDALHGSSRHRWNHQIDPGTRATHEMVRCLPKVFSNHEARLIEWPEETTVLYTAPSFLVWSDK